MPAESSTTGLPATRDRIDTLIEDYRDTLGTETVITRLTAETGTSVSIPEPTDGASDATSRLDHIVATFDLSEMHRAILLLALAPDIDPTFHDRFCALHDDMALDRPTLAMIGDLFGSDPADKLTATDLVGNDSPLRQHDLLTIVEPADSDRSRLLSSLRVTDRIHEYLLGHDGLDPALEGVATLESAAETTLDDLGLDDAVHERAQRLDGASGRFYLYGPEGAGKSRIPEARTEEFVLEAALPAVLEADSLTRLRREATLLECPLHLTDAQTVIEDDAAPALESIYDALSDLAVDVFVTGTDAWTPTGTMATELDAIVEFPYPSMDLREQFWESHAEELPDEVDPAVLAGTFRLTQVELEAALATARSLADGELTAEDVYDGCAAQSAGELEALAQRIEPASSWEDIQLREKTERKLRIVRDHVTHPARIYRDWGFEEHFSRGTGIVALFSGPSGTGKTMAAEILANEVGMDLYKIDLSSVVSKYIGETEENLEEIFEAAENSNAILLFDEADAVFGDRAEVSSATDRYANVEVNYLLQRIEAYDGVVLLTTNYESNIDSAFTRRIDHTVSFKRPEEATREAIWRGIFPEDAPLGEIDYDFLASRDFTGGQIKTIGQTAAILAAKDDRIGMCHVIHAIQLEVQKIGRLFDPDEFGEYQQYLYDIGADPDDGGETGSQMDEQTECEYEDETVTTGGECESSPDPAESGEDQDDESTVEQTVSTDPTNKLDSASETDLPPEIVTAPTKQSATEKQTVASGDSSAETPDSAAEEGDQEQDDQRSLAGKEGSPEDVVRTVIDRIRAVDPDGIENLYHPRAVTGRFSRGILKRLRDGDITIDGGIKRVRDESDRVVVQFTQRYDDDTRTVEYELRIADDDWCVFDIRHPREDGIVSR